MENPSFPYHHGELVKQAFTQTAPESNEFFLHHQWVKSKLVTGGWGSADAGYPFKQEVIQHVMAALVNAFATDGVFPQPGCEYNPARKAFGSV